MTFNFSQYTYRPRHAAKDSRHSVVKGFATAAMTAAVGVAGLAVPANAAPAAPGPAGSVPPLPQVQLPQLPPPPKLPPVPQAVEDALNKLGMSANQIPGSSAPNRPVPNRPAPNRPAPNPGYKVRTIHNLPARTSLAVVTNNGIAKTPNADEARPGLSIVKLYMADYVLRYGDRSNSDRYLAERMIRFSDDGAASKINRKYPRAISTIAREYGLRNTRAAAHWGNSYTSATDTARFLHQLRIRHPRSAVLHWMRTAAPVAADGTRQDWGTVHLPGVNGTKWGWSDSGPQTLASASFGNGYTVASFSWGGRGVQNADTRAAAGYLR
ncbi:hypothetical protein ACN4D7_07570 [Corynebacterium macclintockiae]|uniref:hypothetical protein n=1 Tax=Corynebacterium macclintockiae TaxID=2913501 RepID=UPI003EBBFF6B